MEKKWPLRDGVTDRKSTFFISRESWKEEGRFFIVLEFAELERGQLPQIVIILKEIRNMAVKGTGKTTVLCED